MAEPKQHMGSRATPPQKKSRFDRFLEELSTGLSADETPDKTPDDAPGTQKEGTRRPPTTTPRSSPSGKKDHPFTLEDLNRELENVTPVGEELQQEDFEEIIAKPPKRSSFPYFILTIAVLKDFFDLISLGFFGIILNIFAFIALRIWLLGKVGFMKRYLYRRYIFTLILEFIPFINMIPQWTIFVLRGHAKENKKIDEILTVMEKRLIDFQKGR